MSHVNEGSEVVNCSYCLLIEKILIECIQCLKKPCAEFESSLLMVQGNS